MRPIRYMYEYWYNIPGFFGYQVSNNMEVRSMKNYKTNPGHILKQDKNGYVSLTSDNLTRKRIKVIDLYRMAISNPLTCEPVNDLTRYSSGRSKIIIGVDERPTTTSTETIALDMSNLINK